MRTRVMATGFEVTDAIRAFAQRHLDTLHRSHPDELVHADVFLEDVNGPKGGEDKAVRVRVKLRGGRTVTVEESRADLYEAIALAGRRTLPHGATHPGRAAPHRSPRRPLGASRRACRSVGRRGARRRALMRGRLADARADSPPCKAGSARAPRR